jgi:hypothetical protein
VREKAGPSFGSHLLPLRGRERQDPPEAKRDRGRVVVDDDSGPVALDLPPNIHFVGDQHRARERHRLGDDNAEILLMRKRRCDPIDSSGSEGFSDVRFFRGTAMSLEGSEDERECDDRNGFWRRICRTCGFSSFTFGQLAVVEGAEGPDRAREPRAWSARRRCRPQISDMRAAIDAMAPQARTGRLALVTDGPAEFVEIELEQPSVRNESDAKIEIVVGKVVLRLEQDTASTRIAEIMTALERGA